jgi:hypothetical protein
MSTNPYQSPSLHSTTGEIGNLARRAASRSFRVALLILIVPAVYNLFCFSFATNEDRVEYPIT